MDLQRPQSFTMMVKVKTCAALWMSWFVSRSKSLALIAVLLLVSGLSASLSPIRLAADSLFSAGEYEQAITEYKRYLCYEDPDTINPQTWKNLALCHRETGEYGKALQAKRGAGHHPPQRKTG